MPQALLLQRGGALTPGVFGAVGTYLVAHWSHSSVCVGRAEPGTARWLTPPFSWHPLDALQKGSVNAQRRRKSLLHVCAQKLPSLVHLNLLLLPSPAFFLCVLASSKYFYTPLSLVIRQNEQFFAQVKAITHKCKETGFLISLFIQVQVFLMITSFYLRLILSLTKLKGFLLCFSKYFATQSYYQRPSPPEWLVWSHWFPQQSAICQTSSEMGTHTARHAAVHSARPQEQQR